VVILPCHIEGDADIKAPMADHPTGITEQIEYPPPALNGCRSRPGNSHGKGEVVAVFEIRISESQADMRRPDANSSIGNQINRPVAKETKQRRKKNECEGERRTNLYHL